MVRGQPWAADKPTQYVSPSKLIHATVGVEPSGEDVAKGLDQFFWFTR